MEAEIKNRPTHAILEQATNNTTSWVGHRLTDNEDLASGQTFIATYEGDLETIEVFPTLVTKPGKMIMTLHNFDSQQKSWGPALGSASINVNNSATGKWLAFKIPGMHLNKGKAYGFRLESPDTYVGVGEAAGSYQKPPFVSGQEWQFTKNHKSENSFSYFSLAFKVGTRA